MRLLGEIDNAHPIKPLDCLAFVFSMDRSTPLPERLQRPSERSAFAGQAAGFGEARHPKRHCADQAGAGSLVRTGAGEIAGLARLLPRNIKACESLAFAHNPYKEGSACERIVQMPLAG
ncbi:hypothetical protein IWX85_002751 [Polaromonas sp. CG_9.11]|nr:hypothetical protein [Polaromonas sp. CG_9.11]